MASFLPSGEMGRSVRAAWEGDRTGEKSGRRILQSLAAWAQMLTSEAMHLTSLCSNPPSLGMTTDNLESCSDTPE
jgi:hypothetical protein